jgi:CheY-like chemotaxis protein
MNLFKSVLIIDDDSINNFINVRVLKKLNVADEISVALNGREGIKYLVEHCVKHEVCPDLILLDINMPIMDGFEFLKNFLLLNIKDSEKAIVAVLTTSSNQGDRDEMGAMGVKHYLNKPLTEESIRNLLKVIS